MIFRQVFDNKSSTYTYLIASAKGREAVIIDPVIENVESYINLLNELDLKLVKVIDTHIHADHVTGASKLKQETNCSTLMGEHTPADTVEIKVKDDEIIKAFFASLPKNTGDDISHTEFLHAVHDLNTSKKREDSIQDLIINLSDFVPEPKFKIFPDLFSSKISLISNCILDTVLSNF